MTASARIAQTRNVPFGAVRGSCIKVLQSSPAGQSGISGNNDCANWRLKIASAQWLLMNKQSWMLPANSNASASSTLRRNCERAQSYSKRRSKCCRNRQRVVTRLTQRKCLLPGRYLAIRRWELGGVCKPERSDRVRLLRPTSSFECSATKKAMKWT